MNIIRVFMAGGRLPKAAIAVVAAVLVFGVSGVRAQDAAKEDLGWKMSASLGWFWVGGNSESNSFACGAEAIRKMERSELLLKAGGNAIDAAVPHLPTGRRLVYYPGSSIGNFPPDAAATLLARFRQLAGTEGQLLIGFDLKKDPAQLQDLAGRSPAFKRLQAKLRPRIDRKR